MKSLTIFYSRTGTTKIISEEIKNKLGRDAKIEEIIDTVDRSGIKGFLMSGRDAMKRNLTVLKKGEFNSDDFDLVIIGTPIWGWNISVPVRTYITENKEKFRKVAFFCTMGGSGDQKAFLEMEKIIGKKPVSTLALRTEEVVKNKFSQKLEEFILEISSET